MVHCKIDLWMWFGKELGKDFQSPSDMRSVLELTVEDGTTAGRLFKDLAYRYLPIREKIMTKNRFSPYVVMVMNGHCINADNLYSRVLEDGDEITVLPVYAGG